VYQTITSNTGLDRITNLLLIAILLTTLVAGANSYGQYNPDKEVLLDTMSNDDPVEKIYHSSELTDYDRASLEKLEDSESTSIVVENPPKDSIILSSMHTSVGIVNDNGEVTRIYPEDVTDSSLIHIFWIIISGTLACFVSILYSYHFREPFTFSLTIATIIALYLL
jgi:hypothetical protein